MNGLSTSWKVFRVACIIQLALVALQLMLSLVSLFFNNYFFYALIEVFIYTIIFFFVYQGLSLLNYNYPGTPLTDKQRLQFNWLFIINFLLIAYLFAQVVSNWWALELLFDPGVIKVDNRLALLAPFLFAMTIFVIHLVFLAGMIRLRRVIHQNTLDSWYRQFGETKKEQQQ